MSEELDQNPTDSIITLVQLFHSAVERYRPGARYILTCTDELLMLAFADHGGELENSTVRKSSGPMKAHPSNPGWSPPTWDPVRLRVSGRTGDVTAQVPPILWLPGPGPHDYASEAAAKLHSITQTPPRRGLSQGDQP